MIKNRKRRLLRMVMKNSIKDTSDKARANILSRLKSACDNKSGSIPDRSRSADVFPQTDNLLKTFIEEFEMVNGQVRLCQSQNDFQQQLTSLYQDRNWNNVMCRDAELATSLPKDLLLMDESDFVDVAVGITRCEYLIARSGSIMVSSGQASGRLMNVFPPVHIVVAHEQQLVAFLEDAFELLKKKYQHNMPSQTTVITGPSRTADIEKTLVMGAHGPKELILFIRKY